MKKLSLKQEQLVRDNIAKIGKLVSKWVCKHNIKSYEQLWETESAFDANHSIPLSFFRTIIEADDNCRDLFSLYFL